VIATYNNGYRIDNQAKRIFMSDKKRLNNKELQAVRLVLFLSTAEAAVHIGDGSQRNWQRWERGEFKVPQDVCDKIFSIIELRIDMMQTMEELALAVGDSDVCYFLSFESYLEHNKEGDLLDWRLRQSVASELFINDFCSLV
jgi:hypothetical protein